MKKKYYKLLIIITVIISGSSLSTVVFMINEYRENIAITHYSQYLLQVKKIEQSLIQSLPIYSDYSDKSRKLKLRKHLINEHLSYIRMKRYAPIENGKKLQDAINDGTLISADRGTDSYYYFYNVPSQNRYLRQSAFQCLTIITKRMQDVISEKGDFPVLKIAISSMIRTLSYHDSLKKKNINAAAISSHSYGISFDIFYDDFYISLPEYTKDNSLAQKIIEKTRTDLGFVLGRSLRRQMRSLLAETLLQLQDEGYLYVIEENKQRCYHITSLIPDNSTNVNSYKK
ncbi:MAG TPA: DUF5715 family protein [Spirochaetota bacterium]|nr:DUF5715 family protein [Spirochaetota bacterium]